MNYRCERRYNCIILNDLQVWTAIELHYTEWFTGVNDDITALYWMIYLLINSHVIKVKEKVKITTEQSKKAQRGSRGIALLFL